MSRRIRSVAAVLAAAAFVGAAAGPSTAAAGGDNGIAKASAAQAEHQPAGVGSGRKIG